MMLSTLFFLAALFLSGLFASIWTSLSIKKKWTATLAGAIFHALRKRNWKILLGVSLILLGVAVFEALIPAFHNIMEDLQYGIGDGLGGLEPPGGRFSWALYLSLFFGIVLGWFTGTFFGCKTDDSTSGVSLKQVSL